jgi:hypothetical protein
VNAPVTITCPANKTANAGANCGTTVSLGTPTTTGDNVTVTGTRSDGLPFTDPYPAGTTTITWTATAHSSLPATDSNTTGTATCTQTVVVSDVTPPTIVAPPQTASADANCQGVVPDFIASAAISDNCTDRPAITVTQTPIPGTVVGLGGTTVTLTATDESNNTSMLNTLFTVVDTTPPVISCPANVTVFLRLNTTATSMPVSYPSPATATDNCGPVNITYTPASGSVFPVGATVVTATATDGAGNQSSCTFTVTVLYDFTGFFAPVSNVPTLNVVKAGSAVPIKFSLSGNKGLNVFAANSPQSGLIPCDASVPAIDVVDTVQAGASSLSYDPSTDQYSYVWKTDSSWVGTCRQLIITLNDGSVQIANFKFK